MQIVGFPMRRLTYLHPHQQTWSKVSDLKVENISLLGAKYMSLGIAKMKGNIDPEKAAMFGKIKFCFCFG